MSAQSEHQAPEKSPEDQSENILLTYLKLLLFASFLIGIELHLLEQTSTREVSFDQELIQRPFMPYARPSMSIEDPDPFEFVKMWEAQHAADPVESEVPMRLTVLSSL